MGCHERPNRALLALQVDCHSMSLYTRLTHVWLRYAACFWRPSCCLSGVVMFVLYFCPVHLDLSGLHQYLLLHAQRDVSRSPLHDAPPTHTSITSWAAVTAGQLFGWEFIISFILVSTVYACAIGAPNFGESACSVESARSNARHPQELRLFNKDQHIRVTMAHSLECL